MSLERVKQVPFATKWIISEKELTAMKDTVNGRLHSSFVSTTSCDGGGAKYCIVIYPNGNRDENRGKVMICFGLYLGSLKVVEAKYTITNESANVSQSVQHVFKKTDGWGKYFCDTTDMFNPEKQFFVDGKMAIKVYGILEYNVEDGAEFPITLGHELWDSDYGKDFTLVVDGKDLKVHKVFLTSSSPVFAESFKPGTKEAAAENQLIISDFAYTVVEIAMKGIYAFRYFETYEINALIQFFDKYNIPYLKNVYSSLILRLNGKEPLKDDGITKFEKIDDKNFNVNMTRFPIGDKLWTNDDRKDYKFIVEGKELKVHKLILSKRSPKFAAMFKKKEGAEIDQTIVTDFSYNDVERALKIIYECPSVFKSFEEENIVLSKLFIKNFPSFLQFYEKYNFPSLKDMLERILIDRISAETVCYLSNCSITSNSTKLQERCVEFMKIASASKIPLSDFNILDKEIAAKVSQNPIYAYIRTEKEN